MIDYNINIRAAGYTDAEWLAAQQRQETTDNKVAVSLAYSNASQQPGGTILDAVTVTDAAFLAATRVIEGVTYNGTTADAAISNILHAVALQDLTQIQPIGVVSGGLMG
jgi:transcription termination factor NusB